MLISLPMRMPSILVFFVVSLAVLHGWCSFVAVLAEEQTQSVDRPAIEITEKEHDFGNLNEGVEVRHVFTVRNTGTKRLELRAAFSTCGCTVPHIKHREILPGQTGELEVMLDTSMKQGHVSKPVEVRSNDPVNPATTIYIKANVRSPHADLGEAKAKIFTGRCAACHVEKGKGKLGEELFAADCGMCHGFRGTGIPGVAPSVVKGNYEDESFAAAMKHIICHGSEAHRSMAGYLNEAGGPLNAKEIDSIVAFLKRKSEQLKKEEARRGKEAEQAGKKGEQPGGQKESLSPKDEETHKE